jgi:hypothetical protein
MNDEISVKVRMSDLSKLSVTLVFAILLFLSLVWLGKAQPGGTNNPVQATEATNCKAGTCTNSCSPGSVSFCCATVSNCGLPVIITVGTTTLLGQVVLTITNTNCSTTKETNSITPSIIAQPSWTDPGDNYNQPQSGNQASIRPTAMSGSALFSLTWSNACSSAVEPATQEVGYTLTCPTWFSTTFNSNAGSGDYGASFFYNFDCAKGWYISESVTWLQTNVVEKYPSVRQRIRFC